jgi:ATP-dependent helicase/nuclease subunit A
MVWAGRKADDPLVVAGAREAMLEETEHEYRRLLYVAMTRAADHLIVAGCKPGNRGSIREHSWYDLVEKGLASSGLALQEIETPNGVVKRYARAEEAASAAGRTDETAGAPIVLPEWLRAPVRSEAAAASLLRPSDPSDDDGHPVRSGESILLRAKALQRGTLVHRLLQSLPDLAGERRREAAEKFLLRNAGSWPEAERRQLAERVLALVEDQRFAAVFAAGSRAEVAIVGRLELPGQRPALVSGQIDRLVVTGNEVLIVDFKTNHAPPPAAAEAPPAYVRQLALYRAVLSKLYPQHAVRAALLWTETTDLMEISASALDAELASHPRGDSAA